MKVKVLSNGFPLYRKHPTDAGLDVRLPELLYLFPGEQATVDLGVAIATEPGHVCMLVNRSSLAAKNCVISNFGIIDEDYRGELKAVLFNLSNEIQTFEKGERIVQLLEVPVVQKEPIYVSELTETVRGEGGLGSTN